MRIPGLSGSTQDGAYFGSSGSDAFSGGSSTGATLDYIQEAIDWIGVFDPTGIADFTNGTLFTIRGDYKNAAISYAGVLPGGDLLKAGRLGAKMAARASLIAMPILVKEGKKVYNAIQAGRRAAKGGTFGEKLFLSEKFGITSTKFGNSAAFAKGTLNEGGGWFKAGWSTGQNAAGQWGYKFRIGIGSSVTNPNVAKYHMYLPKSFVPNSFANPSIQVKRSLFNLGLKP